MVKIDKSIGITKEENFSLEEKRENISKKELFNLLHKDGIPVGEIAKRLNTTKQGIEARMEIENIPSPINEEVEYAKLRRRMKKLERKRKLKF